MHSPEKNINEGLAYFPGPDGGRTYARPAEVLRAGTIEEVRPALSRAAEAVDAGMHAAGFLSYEAAPAFDTALRVHPPGPLPLLYLGLYERPEAAPPRPRGSYECGPWNALAGRGAYEAVLRRVREHIAAGDTYQVNYTFPLEAAFEGDALAYFEALSAAQGGGYPAYIDTGRFKILSASPELFFSLEGGRLTCKPMKGTRPRGRWSAEDQDFAAALAASGKDRAENIMIVDMVRNDLGRIAAPGGVDVTRFFEVERYETVWQMTSTVTAETSASVPDIFAALFPCASVTGAPKVETMKIIRALESHPRGVYCGAVGWWAPRGKACFNVPIRTVCLDTGTGRARYHVGSGVTWDSAAALEYQECLDKAALLAHTRPEMDLLETMLWEGGAFFLLEGHLARLEASAAYFAYPCDRADVEKALWVRARGLGEGNWVLRLCLAKDGSFRIEERPAPPAAEKPLKIALATEPVDAADVLLHHKTTARGVYEAARASRPDCDDVLLWNTRGELTESCIANVVLRLDGELLTPPRESGLLGGVFREHLLAQGEIAEALLRKEDLRRAEQIFLINSVRRWREAEVVDG